MKMVMLAVVQQWPSDERSGYADARARGKIPRRWREGVSGVEEVSRGRRQQLQL
jgi:hypothetical protein